MAELGNHHVSFPSSDNNGANDGIVLGPFGAGVSGTITEFHVYADNGGGPNIRPIIYGADGTDPGALVATLAQMSLNNTARWWDLTGLSVAFTGPIYIGFWQQSSGGFNYYYNGAGPGFYKSGLAAYHATNAAPTPWPKASDAAADGQSIAIYVVYTPTPSAPTNDTPAAVTGTVRVGQTLTADAATAATRWTGEDTVTGKWQDSATSGGVYADIAAQTASTYVIGVGELTKYIRYLETATNAGGSTTQASNVVGPVTAASGGASTASVSHAAVAVEIILI